MSSARRPVILMGILLLLLAGIGAYAYIDYAGHAPLAGRNSITGFAVKPGPGGTWTAEFDYFFTGEPATARLQVDMQYEAHHDIKLFPSRTVTRQFPPPSRGAHHVSFDLKYPGGAGASRQFTARMFDSQSNALLLDQHVERLIEWPEELTYYRWKLYAQSTPEQNLDHVVQLIDSNFDSQLDEARFILERLIADHPRMAQAYVELARASLRNDRGPEGLHHAENLLASALQVEPKNVIARILLGSVYVQEDRFSDAAPLFVDIARTDPPNLWVWTHWGELLQAQGRTDQAVEKFRVAIAHPMTHTTYDRARQSAYVSLLAILKDRKDLDGMEVLYKQRVAEFGPGACYSADYARFLLQVRGDPQAAIDLAQRALNSNCEDSGARRILGLANYAKWASTASGPQQNESLNQARIYLPASATSLYLLARADRTVPAARKLVESGEKIDQKDNERMTALAYALQDHEIDAAKQLLKLGARADTPVGEYDMPAALIPVLQADVPTIRMLQSSGVNYSKLRFRGATAYDFAKQSGNEKLMQALKHEETTL